VAEVPVHRQLAAPLAACALSFVVYRVLAGWNPWVAIAASTVLYLICLIQSGNGDLAMFVLSMLRRPIASKA